MTNRDRARSTSHPRSLTTPIMAFALIVAMTSVPASAHKPEDGGLLIPETETEAQAHLLPSRELNPPLAEVLTIVEMETAQRLDDALVDLLHASFVDSAKLHAVADFELRSHTRFGSIFEVLHDKPVVDFTVVGDLETCLDDLRRATGVEILAAVSAPYYHVVSALVPPTSLLQAAAAPGVVSASATGAMTAITSSVGKEDVPEVNAPSIAKSQGAADNQAEEALNVDAVRRVFPTANGAGVSVGTLSDSVNQVGNGISASQSSSDLPGNGNINVLQDYSGTNPPPTDEGRAMMEHIHDIAPSLSSLGFATAFGGSATFAGNITALSNAGMDIINDDVVRFDEPYYQDGVIAQAVVSHINGGGIYFALNHNYANLSYEGVFSDGDTDNYHNYSGNDETLQITIASGTPANPITAAVGLQWAQPWAAATTDLSLELWSSDLSTLLASTATNNIGGNPNDILFYTNTTGSAVTAKLSVKRISGSTSNLTFKFVTFANGAWQVSHDEYATGAGTLTPHAGTTVSIAIGAAPFYAPDTAESFSGQGPHRRFFNSAGSPVGPFTLTKPDFLAIDRCNTTFFGVDRPEDADFLPNFGGTSAATPNAAAVAALMLQQAGGPGTLTQDDIKEAMKVSAIDLGPAGHDILNGHGRIHALGATMAATGPRSPEYTLFANQFGDVSFDQNLFGITDIDRFEIGLKTAGSTVIDIIESDADMDPMMVVFFQILNDPVVVDYDSGPGDDARVTFDFASGIPYTVEVASEEDFSSTALYTISINGPDQSVIDRTSNLDANGDDPGFDGTISIIGGVEYLGYDAPFDGSLTVTLEAPAFDARILVYDQSGVLITASSVSSGQTGSVSVPAVVAGQQTVVQVAASSYHATGSYRVLANFEKEVSGLVFSDAFESGSASMWSSSTP